MSWRWWRRGLRRRRRAGLVRRRIAICLLSITTSAASVGAGSALASSGRNGASYSGTTSLGGTVVLKVSSDGRRVVSSSFRFRPRSCTRGDYLSGTLDTGPRDKIVIGSAGRFHRRFKRVRIGSNGKAVGTTTIVIAGRFRDNGASLRGKVSYSRVRFYNGGRCPNFGLRYRAPRSS